MRHVEALLPQMLVESAMGVEMAQESRLRISLCVSPSRLCVTDEARVVVRVCVGGRPVEGHRLRLTTSRGKLSRRSGRTQSGVLSASLRGQPGEEGLAVVRVHSDVWEAQAVLSVPLEFVAETEEAA